MISNLYFKIRMTPRKELVQRGVTEHNSANKHDTTIVKLSEKSSTLGLPKYFVADRNFDRQHHLIT